MRLPSAAALVAVAALTLAACRQESTAEESGRPEVPRASGFDFFVLALSWSPSYCASEGKHANRQQCGPDAPDYGFVVHGLWPQYESGYPSDCPTDHSLDVPRDLAGTMLDIMPSTGLIQHEWRKHGTCSGVSPQDYFTLTRLAFERVAIPGEYRGAEAIRPVDPDSVEAAFRAANPGLAADAIAVTCDRHYIRDVRICIKRDLSGFVACPQVDDDGCRRDTAVMPPVR
ncbi:ribonuclease T2 family protein [Oricola thermophila]|uniref:Ribonuclease T n=1 Tax=Oricola thermophila TaxID=2742145 RepID=A0A6N1VBZ6_9HYPH|nr:ribonuclease T [Oricola thermophila]QKV18400.1 ribonuclease T [Oricola thermophila]